MNTTSRILIAVLVFALLALAGWLIAQGQGFLGTSPSPSPTLPITASPTASPALEVRVTLDEQNDSGESGTATIRDENGVAVVTLNIQGAPATAQPAHIHAGACPNPGAIRYPLLDVVNGQSRTVLNVSTAQVLSQLPLAVNVHRSAQQINTYVACGDVEAPAGFSPSPTTTTSPTGSPTVSPTRTPTATPTRTPSPTPTR